VDEAFHLNYPMNICYQNNSYQAAAAAAAVVNNRLQLRLD
jgi:hypothetical protein